MVQEPCAIPELVRVLGILWDLEILVVPEIWAVPAILTVLEVSFVPGTLVVVVSHTLLVPGIFAAWRCVVAVVEVFEENPGSVVAESVVAAAQQLDA